MGLYDLHEYDREYQQALMCMCDVCKDTVSFYRGKLKKSVEAEAKRMLEDFMSDILNDFIDWRKSNINGSVEHYLKHLKQEPTNSKDDWPLGGPPLCWYGLIKKED